MSTKVGSTGRRGRQHAVPTVAGWKRFVAFLLSWAMVFELTPAQAIKFAYAADTDTAVVEPVAEANADSDENELGGGCLLR